MAVLFGFI